MEILQIKDLTKHYSGKGHAVLDNVSLNVTDGEILALLGESGSGKTTLLRLISGLDSPDKGNIILNNAVITDEKIFLAPEKRKIGMVFQNHALFPHFTIYENIAFGLKGKDYRLKRERTGEMLALVGLSGYEKRYPHQLSGGQQQRVALARALAPEPSVLLMDEPFSNLDTVLKNQVREETRKILKKAHITTIFVTHDTKDALLTADRIALMKMGKIMQVATPKEIYTNPLDHYIGQFFGNINIIKATIIAKGCLTEIGFIEGNFLESMYDEEFQLMLRPEQIVLCSSEESDLNGNVTAISYLGDHQQLVIKVNVRNSEAKPEIKINASCSTLFQTNQKVYFKVNLENAHIFPRP